MNIHITNVNLSGSFEGLVLSDELNSEQLQAIGYNLPIGNSNDNFDIEVIGSYESECSHDHECYVTVFDVSLIGPSGDINIDACIDSDKLAETIEQNCGPDIWQDWYEGLGDYYEYMITDR
jgi:hypothetical protein